MQSEMEIVEASSADIPSILEINHQYLDSTDENGFLVVPYYKSDLDRVISSAESTIFLAKSNSDGTLGYAKVSSHFQTDILKGMVWNSEGDKELTTSILGAEYTYIGQVAVKQDTRRKGVASKIYSHIENLNRAIIVFVAWVPRKNMASFHFHESRSYRKVGVLSRPVFGRFEDYQSLCYVRK
jgi:L-amino acid N-acyltransferase YncA